MIQKHDITSGQAMTFELRYFRELSTTDDIYDIPWQSLIVGETSSLLSSSASSHANPSPSGPRPRIDFSSKVETRCDLYLVVPDARFGLKLRDVADQLDASELGINSSSSGGAVSRANMPKHGSIRVSTAAKLCLELKVRTNLDASRAEAFSKYTGKIRLASAGGLRALLCCSCANRGSNPLNAADSHSPGSASSSCSERDLSADAPHAHSDTVSSAATSALADNGAGGCACEAKAARTLLELALALLDEAGGCFGLGLGLGGADADSLAALRAYATAGAVRLVLVSKRRRCGMAARALGLEDARVECLPFANFCSASPPSSASSALSASSLVYRSASIEGPLPLVSAAAAHAHAWFTDGGHQNGGGAEWKCSGYPAFLASTFFGPSHSS